MNVVTRHMMTITVKTLELRIPLWIPRFSTMISTRPLVFMRMAMTLQEVKAATQTKNSKVNKIRIYLP